MQLIKSYWERDDLLMADKAESARRIERFNRIVRRAEDEAARHRHATVQVEDLFVGLVMEPSTLPGLYFHQRGIDYVGIRMLLQKQSDQRVRA